MGRSTKRNISTTNVSTSEIREVINSDALSKPIPSRVRKASDFFVDGETNDSIYNNFIDGDYCPADPEETKKAKLTREPFKWSHWRNYGGNEGAALPEIYWESAINFLGNECIPNASVVADYKTVYETDRKIVPRITVYPNLDVANNYSSTSLSTTKGLVSTSASILHRTQTGSDLNQSDLATKVGIDYTGTPPGLPEFQIKITPYIMGEALPSFNTSADNASFDVLTGWGIAETLTTVSSTIESTLPKALLDLHIEQWMAEHLGRAYTAEDLEVLRGLFGQGQGGATTLTTTLGAISAILAAIMIIDMVWDELHTPINITDALYQYSNAVLGNYSFNDILNSTYSIACGNKNYFTDQGVNSTEGTGIKVTADGYSHTFNLDTPNYGSAFNVDTNLITSFPNPSTTREKYLNLKFAPKANQYDLSVPPPVIEYLVELVAVNNCLLSSTKVTAFTVKIMPDRYEAPIFGIETSSTDPNTRQQLLYKNSSIAFKNARFVDFILMKDLDIDDEVLGLGGQYYDVAFNRDGNIINYYDLTTPLSTTFYQEFTGNNLVITPNQLLNPTGEWMAEEGEYDIYFMQETVSNVIFNPYFRVEKDDEVGRRYAELKRFWNYGTDLQIRSGAIYKDSVSSGVVNLYQTINTTASTTYGNSFYTLKLDITVGAGTCDLLTTGTCFENNVYSAYSVHIPGSTVQRYVADSTEYGVTLGANYIRFSTSGTYYLVLKAISPVLSRLSFNFSTDFTGNISKCLLQKLPNQAAGGPSGVGFNFFGTTIPVFDITSRGARNAITYYGQMQPAKIKYIDENLTVADLYIDYAVLDGQSYSFSLSLPPYHVANVSWRYLHDVEAEVVGYTDYVTTGTYDITSVLTDDNIDVCKITIANIYEGEDTDLQKLHITSLTSNDIKVEGIKDDFGLLEDATVDLVDTSFGKCIVTQEGRRTVINGSIYGTLGAFKIKLKSLDLSGTLISENIGALSTNFPHTSTTTKTITNITDYVNFSNTDVTGDLAPLLGTTTIVLDGTNISQYSSGYPTYIIGTEPSITWKNSNIDLESLHKLILDLDTTTLENGTLDIAGDNPEITNTTVLDAIDSLTAKGWNISYNKDIYYSECTIESITTEALTLSFLTNLSDTDYEYLSTEVVFSLSSNPEDMNIGSIAVPFDSIIEEGNLYRVTASWANPTEVFSEDQTIYVWISYLGLVLGEITSFVVHYEEEWTYEGVMTVGYNENTPVHNEYGYETGGTGEIDPLLDFDEVRILYNDWLDFVYDNFIEFFAYNEIGGTAVFTGNIILRINQTSYTLSYDSGFGKHLFFLESNPFPSSGQTCDIKLRYTLVEPPVFPEVTIGTQTWMSVNLDIDDLGGGIYAYNDDEANVATYGRLYTWDAAVRVAAAQTGWHLPSQAEWQTLYNYISTNSQYWCNSNNQYTAKSVANKLYWNVSTEACSPGYESTTNNSTGMSIVPSGIRTYPAESFVQLGNYAGMWTNEKLGYNGYYKIIFYGTPLWGGFGFEDIDNGFSVRLIKD